MAPRGGKRGSRASIQPSSGKGEAVEVEHRPAYSHAVGLQQGAGPQRAEIVPTRTGADMPDVLETATWMMRERMRQLRERLIGSGNLDPKEWAELRAMMDPLSKLGREVRAWRKLQAAELAELNEGELHALIPEAAKALGISEEDAAKMLGLDLPARDEEE